MLPGFEDHGKKGYTSMKKKDLVRFKNLSIGAMTVSDISARNVAFDGGNVDCNASMANGVPTLMFVMFCDLREDLILLMAGTRSYHIWRSWSEEL